MVDYRKILLSEIPCIPCSLLLYWLQRKEDLLAVWGHVFLARASLCCSELYAQYNHNCTVKLSLTLQGNVHQIKFVALMRTDCCSWCRHLRRTWDMDQWFLCIVLLLKSPKSISRCLCSLGVTVLHLIYQGHCSMSLFQDSTGLCPFYSAFSSHPVSVVPSAKGLQSLGPGSTI